jgi:two-component system, OmpR family, response regulator
LKKDSSASSRTILLVEDETEMAIEMKAELEENGYLVRTVSIAKAAAIATANDAALLILDRLLDGEDSLKTLEILRKQNVKIPVLMVSVLSSPDEITRGLLAGADDYLSKPFYMIELVARVDALLRRLGNARATKLRVDDLEMDLIDRTVFQNGLLIHLLPGELKLLEYFLRHPNQVVTRTMLLEDVWQYRRPIETNVIDMQISNLRRKIDQPGRPSRIVSVRRHGFMLRSREN